MSFVLTKRCIDFICSFGSKGCPVATLYDHFANEIERNDSNLKIYLLKKLVSGNSPIIITNQPNKVQLVKRKEKEIDNEFLARMASQTDADKLITNSKTYFLIAELATRKSFLGLTSLVDYSDKKFRLLERIGMSREEGVISEKLNSELKFSPKDMFFMLKQLLDCSLIVRKTGKGVFKNRYWLFRYRNKLNYNAGALDREKSTSTESQLLSEYKHNILNTLNSTPSKSATANSIKKLFFCKGTKMDGHEKRRWQIVNKALKNEGIIEDCFIVYKNKKLPGITLTPNHINSSLSNMEGHPDGPSTLKTKEIKEIFYNSRLVKVPKKLPLVSFSTQIKFLVQEKKEKGIKATEVSKELNLCKNFLSNRAIKVDLDELEIVKIPLERGKETDVLLVSKSYISSLSQTKKDLISLPNFVIEKDNKVIKKDITEIKNIKIDENNEEKSIIKKTNEDNKTATVTIKKQSEKEKNQNDKMTVTTIKITHNYNGFLLEQELFQQIIPFLKEKGGIISFKQLLDYLGSVKNRKNNKKTYNYFERKTLKIHLEKLQKQGKIKQIYEKKRGVIVLNEVNEDELDSKEKMKSALRVNSASRKNKERKIVSVESIDQAGGIENVLSSPRKINKNNDGLNNNQMTSILFGMLPPLMVRARILHEFLVAKFIESKSKGEEFITVGEIKSKLPFKTFIHLFGGNRKVPRFQEESLHSVTVENIPEDLKEALLTPSEKKTQERVNQLVKVLETIGLLSIKKSSKGHKTGLGITVSKEKRFNSRSKFEMSPCFLIGAKCYQFFPVSKGESNEELSSIKSFWKDFGTAFNILFERNREMVLLKKRYKLEFIPKRVMDSELKTPSKSVTKAHEDIWKTFPKENFGFLYTSTNWSVFPLRLSQKKMLQNLEPKELPDVEAINRISAEAKTTKIQTAFFYAMRWLPFAAEMAAECDAGLPGKVDEPTVLWEDIYYGPKSRRELGIRKRLRTALQSSRDTLDSENISNQKRMKKTIWSERDKEVLVAAVIEWHKDWLGHCLPLLPAPDWGQKRADESKSLQPNESEKEVCGQINQVRLKRLDLEQIPPLWTFVADKFSDMNERSCLGCFKRFSPRKKKEIRETIEKSVNKDQRLESLLGKSAIESRQFLRLFYPNTKKSKRKQLYENELSLAVLLASDALKVIFSEPDEGYDSELAESKLKCFSEETLRMAFSHLKSLGFLEKVCSNNGKLRRWQMSQVFRDFLELKSGFELNWESLFDINPSHHRFQKPKRTDLRFSIKPLINSDGKLSFEKIDSDSKLRDIRMALAWGGYTAEHHFFESEVENETASEAKYCDKKDKNKHPDFVSNVSNERLKIMEEEISKMFILTDFGKNVLKDGIPAEDLVKKVFLKSVRKIPKEKAKVKKLIKTALGSLHHKKEVFLVYGDKSSSLFSSKNCAICASQRYSDSIKIDFGSDNPIKNNDPCAHPFEKPLCPWENIRGETNLSLTESIEKGFLEVIKRYPGRTFKEYAVLFPVLRCSQIALFAKVLRLDRKVKLRFCFDLNGREDANAMGSFVVYPVVKCKGLLNDFV